MPAQATNHACPASAPKAARMLPAPKTSQPSANGAINPVSIVSPARDPSGARFFTTA